MKSTRNLTTVDKNKLSAFLSSFPLSKPQLQKLYKIDFEKGYDLNNTKCIELALATMTRGQKQYLVERVVNKDFYKLSKSAAVSAITIFASLSFRDVKITAIEHKEMLEKIPLKNLPPLPINIQSRIHAIAYQLEIDQTGLFKLLMQFPAYTFVGDDLSD